MWRSCRSCASARTGSRWRPDPAGGTGSGESARPRLLVRIHGDYAPSRIIVTENGAAFDDVAIAEGTVDDPDRIAFLRDHLLAAHAAIAAGVPLEGFFVWSFLDNFEWSHGYSKRFGLVHVDFETQKRTPKASARMVWGCRASRRAASSVTPFVASLDPVKPAGPGLTVRRT